MRPALSVQEEECEARRHCDAAGGPTRYAQVEGAWLRVEVKDETVLGCRR